VRGSRSGESGRPWERVVDKAELRKLQEFLRKSLDNQRIKVAPGKRTPDDAEVQLGERQIGAITVDDEDGDRSFSFEMKIPVERLVLQDYLRRLFETAKLTVVPRGRKSDSFDLNNGGDFLGVISPDDPQAKSFTLQMAILDFDLDEL
jgi:hypothetical protein